MASIQRMFTVAAPPEKVWDAVRDFGAVHTRLAAGFVTHARMDGDARIVTFANGATAREMLVDCDDGKRRLVYAIANERIRHYNAAVEITGEHKSQSQFIWTVDLLPNELAPYIGAQMDEAVIAMKRTLES